MLISDNIAVMHALPWQRSQRRTERKSIKHCQHFSTKEYSACLINIIDNLRDFFPFFA